MGFFRQTWRSWRNPRPCGLGNAVGQWNDGGDVVDFLETAFLNDRLTFRLDVLADEAIRANDEFFVETIGCTIREVRVLRLIDDYPGITFIEICRATGFERSLASRTIRRLLALQFVRRDNTDDDARRFLLSTTKLGKQRRIASRALSDRLEEMLLQPLTSHELKQLKSMLDRLALWVRSSEYNSALATYRHSTQTQRKKKRLQQGGTVRRATGTRP
jgi:DNA-binding MarR family transcriptional regulator